MTLFVTWQLRVTLDSIRNSCDVWMCESLEFVNFLAAYWKSCKKYTVHWDPTSRFNHNMAIISDVRDSKAKLINSFNSVRSSKRIRILKQKKNSKVWEFCKTLNEMNCKTNKHHSPRTEAYLGAWIYPAPTKILKSEKISILKIFFWFVSPSCPLFLSIIHHSLLLHNMSTSLERVIIPQNREEITNWLLR